MLIYLHATNQHPRLNHLGEINQKPKKGIFTQSHPCVAVTLYYYIPFLLYEKCEYQDKTSGQKVLKTEMIRIVHEYILIVMTYLSFVTVNV